MGLEDPANAADSSTFALPDLAATGSFATNEEAAISNSRSGLAQFSREPTQRTQGNAQQGHGCASVGRRARGGVTFK